MPTSEQETLQPPSRRPRSEYLLSTSEQETLRPSAAVVAWALAVMVVVVPALCRLPGLPAVESSDRALFELRTRDVFSLDPPLVGAYSRYGWNHPGPVFHYLFAVPYRLMGTDATAIRLCAVLFTAGMMGWMAVLLRRQGRAANIAVAAACVAVVAMQGGLLPLDTWNPTLAILPVMVVLVAAALTMEGPTPGRIGSVLAAASLAAQAHSGTAVVLLPVVGLAIFTAARVWWRAGHPLRGLPRAWWGWAGLIALVWLPVVVDTLWRWPGNLADVARWALRSDEPSAGPREGFGVVARATSLSWPWNSRDVTFLRTIDVGVGVAPGAVIVLLAAARWWTRGRRQRHAVDAALAGWAGALVGAAGLRGPRYDYLVAWLFPLVAYSWAVLAMVAAAIAAGATRRSGDPGRAAARARTAMLAGAAAGGVAIGVVAAVSTVRVDHPDTRTSAAAVALATAVPAVDGAVVEVRRLDDVMLSGLVAAGLANALDARGTTLAEPGLDALYGPRRSARVADTVVGVRAWTAPTPVPDGARQLACWGLPSPADETRQATLREDLAALLVDGDREDLIPLLDTANAAIVLAADPPAAVAARAGDVRDLAALQSAAGDAVCLYAL